MCTFEFLRDGEADHIREVTKKVEPVTNCYQLKPQCRAPCGRVD